MFKTKTHAVACVAMMALAVSYVPVFLEFIGILISHYSLLFSFLVGAAAFAFLYIVFARKKDGMWSTFEHEMTHAIVALLLFTKVRSLAAGEQADRNGRLGVVYHDGVGPLRNILISLAPYFMPTYCLLVMLVMPFASGDGLIVLRGILGFAFGYHIWSTWNEYGYYQTDITSNGKFFSTVFIACANFILIPFVMVVGLSDVSAGGTYLVDGPCRLSAWCVEAYGEAARYVRFR